ncbi:MAG: glycerol-3-phosphate acyltransferase [Papillibacter sp.]|jgi:membrane protein YdbS with pleckstrin-like domain|nr:glycerol-3-phosphate acyltransferase [Papillibacter sp.]
MENSEQYEVTADGTSEKAPVTERKKPKTVFVIAVALIVSLGNLISALIAVLIWYYTGNGILAVILMLLIIAALFVIVMYLIIKNNRKAEHNNSKSDC